MRVAQRELEQQQTCHADKKQGCKLEVIRGVPEQQKQVAATFPADHEERNRHQQGDLGQEHKLGEAEPLGGQKRKRFLHGDQERGGDRV